MWSFLGVTWPLTPKMRMRILASRITRKRSTLCSANMTPTTYKLGQGFQNTWLFWGSRDLWPPKTPSATPHTLSVKEFLVVIDSAFDFYRPRHYAGPRRHINLTFWPTRRRPRTRKLLLDLVLGVTVILNQTGSKSNSDFRFGMGSKVRNFEVDYLGNLWSRSVHLVIRQGHIYPDYWPASSRFSGKYFPRYDPWKFSRQNFYGRLQGRRDAVFC